MATFDIQPSFLSVVGNGQTGSPPIGGQDELIPFRRSETITLSTSGATTDSTEYLLPANSIILAVTASVQTTITGSGVSAFTVGDATVAARFATGIALTAGTVATGITMLNGNINATNAGPTQGSAAKVRITATGGTAATGVVRITVFGFYGSPVAS